MFRVNSTQGQELAEILYPMTSLPIAIQVHPDLEIEELIPGLSPEIPWLERQTAARKLGSIGTTGAIQVLESCLRTDPFWMVRCVIIQSLEMIGDPAVIPTLENVAVKDSFQAVRSAAAAAVENLRKMER